MAPEFFRISSSTSLWYQLSKFGDLNNGMQLYKSKKMSTEIYE